MSKLAAISGPVRLISVGDIIMAQVTWTGGNADWSVSSHWLNGSGAGGQPNQNDSVTINNGSTVSIAAGESYPGTNNSYQGLTISGASTLNVNGTIGSVGAVTLGANSALTISSTGVANLNDGLAAATGSIFTVDGTTAIQGAAFTSSGLTTVGNGVIFTVTNGLTVNIGGSLQMQSGSSLTTYGIVVNGTMDIAADATVASSNGLTANGAVTIEGTYTGGNGIYGTGSVMINGGTVGTAAYPMYGQQTAGITINNGGTLYWSGGSGPINFGTASAGQTNTLILSNESNQVNTPITNFGANSVIEFLGNNATTISGVTVSGTSTTGVYAVAIINSGQPIVTLNNVTFAAGITPVKNGTTNTYTVAGLTDQPITGGTEIYCFLAGSEITTPTGTATVETLRPGSIVTTLVNGAAVMKPVKWIGYRHVNAGDLSGDDAHPVRISAGAFADNVPCRDLLLTCEHGIFIDGGLIPVRMLVNGRSIIFDITISNFTYYHVELHEHSILLAEGLPVESYLDNGDRGKFSNAEIADIRPKLTIRAPGAMDSQRVVPLCVTSDAVKPCWEALNKRADALGLPDYGIELSLTNDPDVHLLTGNGTVIRPFRSAEDRVWFIVPAGSRPVSLVSRTARPCDTMGRYIDDRRALGVSVGEVALHEGANRILITAHLAAPFLKGWHAPEGPKYRWTSGHAQLPLPNTAWPSPAILEVQILQAGPYIDVPTSHGIMAA